MDSDSTQSNEDRNMEETLSSLASLISQEEGVYQKCPCLLVPDMNGEYVDIECRAKMIEWCYQIVEFSNFNRVCVEVTSSYVDRFLVTDAGCRALQDRSLYQLVCMSALYIAVKLHDDVAVMDPQMISAFSRATYTPQEFERMELVMLSALDWKLNPPTMVAFLSLYLSLIPESVLHPFVKQQAYEVAVRQTEVAIADYKLISAKPSIIAYCSFMNALEHLLNVGVIQDVTLLGYVGFVLARSIGLEDSNDPYVILIQHRLFESLVTESRQDYDCVIISALDTSHHQQEHSLSEDVTMIEGNAKQDEESILEVSPRLVILD